MHELIATIEALPNYQLHAIFTNGQQRMYDIQPWFARVPVFEDLRVIPGLFELVRVDCGGHGVAWNNEIDLASEEIWCNGTPIPH